jgi:ribonuclease-3
MERDLERRLGYKFKKRETLERALIHPSCQGQPSLYERLEFLGDAVIGMVASDLLYHAFPESREGSLSQMRASLVNAKVLASKAGRLHLGRFLKMGKGEEKTGGREKPSVLAAAFEVMIGAVYLDGGIEAARKLIEREIAPELQGVPTLEDNKTSLQEFCQGVFHKIPTYRLVATRGPDHDPEFETEIFLGGELLGRGKGKSKKDAEQQAAQRALEQLRARAQSVGGN